MRQYTVLVLLFLGIAFAAPSARALDEKRASIEEMEQVISVLDQLSDWVEDMDLGRVHMIRQRAQAVVKSLQERGSGNTQTIRRYQDFIVTFHYSSALLKQIETNETRDLLLRLKQTTEHIVEERDLGGVPQSLTAETFSQMHELLLQLRAMSGLPSDLEFELDGINPELGRLIALARQGGDRPNTFKLATPMYLKIKALYPLFHKVRRAGAAYDIVIDIEGLNEFYAEYAQIDGRHEEEKP